MADRLTVTLTGRPPVNVVKAEWPILASGETSDHDGGEHESEANRKTRWRLLVRQHADGRCIVYGIHTHETAWQHERGRTVRGGLLTEVGGADIIVAAIQQTAADMEERVGDGVFARLAHECIGDLPAVEL